MTYTRDSFTVELWPRGKNWFVRASDNMYLHSDGILYANAGEFWPRRDQAEAVLDKFYPAPKHEWKHGDVFLTHSSGCRAIYLHPARTGPQAFTIHESCQAAATNLEGILEGAKFLFNIREVTDEQKG